MSRFISREDIYNQIPLTLNDNRDEHILIDALGNWIPECDLIYYGLLNSHYSQSLYKLANTSKFYPKDIYLDTCYFTGDDLIRFLASPDDTLVELSDDYLNEATKTALDNYAYIPCNETMLRHALIELSYFDMVKSITILYPWDIREIDIEYLRSIIPHTILGKFKIATGSIPEYIKSRPENTQPFTTIIMNSISELNLLIDNCSEYRTKSSFFLLRNHSGNVSYRLIEKDGELVPKFDELGSMGILTKLIDEDRLIPKTEMRFARYEPLLFEDAKPDPKNFELGR